MEKGEFKLILLDNAKKIKMDLEDKQVDKLYEYMNLLLNWNEKMNLTAITEPKEIILKHFIDSITIAKYIKENDKIIDIGTGAGFPGIPIKILKPNIEIVLLDSLNKRIKFLDEVIEKLNLKKIETVHSRAEDFGRNVKKRESFDIVMSRAVAKLAVLLEYMMPLARMHGKCISMKGVEIEEEIKLSKNAINVLGGKIVEIDSFYLPNSDIKRNNIIIEKIKNTPSRFPRKAGMPMKEPIN